MPDMTGWTKAQRQARRQMYADRAIQQARVFERSIKCAAQFPRHADVEEGCRGISTCLCECHDPAGAR